MVSGTAFHTCTHTNIYYFIFSQRTVIRNAIIRVENTLGTCKSSIFAYVVHSVTSLQYAVVTE